MFTIAVRNSCKKFSTITTVLHCDMTESKHVKSSFLSGVLQSTLRGMRYREMQGDINQQGGAFILGPGGYLRFSLRSFSLYLSIISVTAYCISK